MSTPPSPAHNMPPPTTDLTIPCLFIDSGRKISHGDPFDVEVPPNATISDLKKKVKKERPGVLEHVDLATLTVWRCMVPRLLVNVKREEMEEALSTVDFTDKEKAYRPGIRQTITALSLFEDEILLVQLPASRKRSRSLSPDDEISNAICPRKVTISGIWDKLMEYKLIWVRGTPGSGKSTLAHLLHEHAKKSPETNAILFTGWPSMVDQTKAGKFWDVILSESGWVRGSQERMVLIFDEAQATYNDHALWNGYFKNMHLHTNHHVIGFASYGSATSSADDVTKGYTPTIIPVNRRITLRPIDHEDGFPAVGLLFTRQEFDDAMARKFKDSGGHKFDETFLDGLFKVTGGHIGAITDALNIIMSNCKYRNIVRYHNGVFTWDTFQSIFSPGTFAQAINVTSTVFKRGLPRGEDLQKVENSNALSIVAEKTVVNAHEVEMDILVSLAECTRQGWLHSDTLKNENDTHTIFYFFASPLHQWYMEWRLFAEMNLKPPSEAILKDFALAVTRRFDPMVFKEERRIGAAFVQRPPEAQYQDEFYRSSHRHCRGTVVNFSEFGTGQGRVDFYIPSKKWGIELLREGDKLQEHAARFSQSGKYTRTLPLEDYILLDFRSTEPQKKFPNIKNLYRVVFTNSYKEVVVRDNVLKEIDRFTLIRQV